MWLDSFGSHVTWLIRVWRESSSAEISANACILIRYTWKNSFITCDTTHSFMIAELVSRNRGECLYSLPLYVRWLIRYMWLDTNHSLHVTWLIRDKTHSCRTRELVCHTCGEYLYSYLLNVTRLIREWRVTEELDYLYSHVQHDSYVRHTSLIYVTRHIYTCDTTHLWVTAELAYQYYHVWHDSYVWQDTFICVTRLIYMLYLTWLLQRIFMYIYIGAPPLAARPVGYLPPKKEESTNKLDMKDLFANFVLAMSWIQFFEIFRLTFWLIRSELQKDPSSVLGPFLTQMGLQWPILSFSPQMAHILVLCSNQPHYLQKRSQEVGRKTSKGLCNRKNISRDVYRLLRFHRCIGLVELGRSSFLEIYSLGPGPGIRILGPGMGAHCKIPLGFETRMLGTCNFPLSFLFLLLFWLANTEPLSQSLSG